ncbi:MAG: hypothetical protein JO208_06365, partial [Alphaproteobacteria bacterium]|nr:hypothetical protein [Alphaproteobacteria bacterium]
LKAAVPEIPSNLIDQLKSGGILIAPVGKPVGAESFSQELVKIIRTEEGTSRQALIPVVFVPMLPGLPQVNSDGSGGQT